MPGESVVSALGLDDPARGSRDVVDGYEFLR
jgi:hypothetical protein